MREWKSLIERSQNGDTKSMLTLIYKLNPKIKKSLQQTTLQEKENLEQELIFRVIKIIHSFNTRKVPGFWEFLNMYDD